MQYHIFLAFAFHFEGKYMYQCLVISSELMYKGNVGTTFYQNEGLSTKYKYYNSVIYHIQGLSPNEGIACFDSYHNDIFMTIEGFVVPFKMIYNSSIK
jgi:hypothetical protein